ncbi:putative dynein heavy chain [Trypanosoma grayi]|uniref:putative dynein heavy chain n=1 Tax=Trypanosoma grayi TaxID=71804 RepID=UPI0004F4BB4E|nr:putative dynein heavy chain [Trypanosoma grayi]KEG11811.1 putative dynein heavy chain [Trypanosoma grayi]
MEGPVHLDNLEQRQEEWLRRCNSHVGVDDPPADIPRIDSPRSLRACTLCGIDPTVALERLSLQQHFNLIVGNAPWVDRSVPTGVVLSDALDACRGAGIVTGTTQQNMQAYRNYMRYEAARVDTLTLAQEVRRQLIAEEMFERRRRAYVDRGVVRSPTESATLRAPEQHMAQSLLPRSHDNVFAAAAPHHVYTNVDAPTAPVAAVASASDALLVAQQQQQQQQQRKQKQSESVVDHHTDRRSILSIDKRTVSGSPHGAETEVAAVIGGTATDVGGSCSRPQDTGEHKRGKNVTLPLGEAPPAPVIAAHEKGERFYYYCANAVAPGRFAEYPEPDSL